MIFREDNNPKREVMWFNWDWNLKNLITEFQINQKKNKKYQRLEKIQIMINLVNMATTVLVVSTIPTLGSTNE